jgi:hypothetical protein
VTTFQGDLSKLGTWDLGMGSVYATLPCGFVVGADEAPQATPQRRAAPGAPKPPFVWLRPGFSRRAPHVNLPANVLERALRVRDLGDAARASVLPPTPPPPVRASPWDAAPSAPAPPPPSPHPAPAPPAATFVKSDYGAKVPVFARGDKPALPVANAPIPASLHAGASPAALALLAEVVPGSLFRGSAEETEASTSIFAQFLNFPDLQIKRFSALFGIGDVSFAVEWKHWAGDASWWFLGAFQAREAVPPPPPPLPL